MRHNRTKIVATLGPASRDADSIEAMIRAGADVFRLNAAHSDPETLVKDMRRVRRVARRLRAGIGVLVDLQGPKIRVGTLVDAEPIWLHHGDRLIIRCDPEYVGHAATEDEVATIGCRYAGLAKDVRRRERILLDDGNIELRVLRVEGDDIHATVVYGGLLKQHKGINLPGSKVSMDSITAEDLESLASVLAEDVDFVALSFVRQAEDVRRLRGKIKAAKRDTRVIAKIERPEAVENLSSILEESDGLMIARGDMGVELGPEVVPGIQKRIIRMANESRKPVITATQMLESMILNPRPTRAEASDVANAIYDGTSAVMLSGESASGKYPVQSVKIMDTIIARTEADLFGDWEYTRRRRHRAARSSVTEATVRAAAFAALESDAKVVAVFTESGRTAELLAGERTPTRLVAFTPYRSTVQRLSLVWGVIAFRTSRSRTSREMTLDGERILEAEGLAKKGDRIIVVVGTSRRKGLTNVMKIQPLGDER